MVVPIGSVGVTFTVVIYCVVNVVVLFVVTLFVVSKLIVYVIGVVKLFNITVSFALKLFKESLICKINVPGHNPLNNPELLNVTPLSIEY